MKQHDVSPERARIRYSLRRIDRRRRLHRVLLKLGPALLAVGGALLLLRLLSPQQPGLAIPLALAAGALLVVCLLNWGRSTDWLGAAELADRDTHQPDLLRSAWSLGDLGSPQTRSTQTRSPQARAPETRPLETRSRKTGSLTDPAWLALIELRAAKVADQVDPRRLIHYKLPGSGFAGLGLMVIWGVFVLLPAASERSLLSLFDQRTRTEDPSQQELAEQLAEEANAEPVLDLSALPLVPMPAELMRSLLDNLGSIDSETLAKLLREAGLLDPAAAGLLSEEALAASFDELGDLSDEQRAAAAALGESLSDLAEGSDLLQELGREVEPGAAPQRRDDFARARGESAAAGEQEAQTGGQREGEADPNAPVQTADSPPKPDGSGGGAQAAQSSAPALAAAAGQTGDMERAEGGGSPMHNPFGPSSGGQDGPTDPFGEATELEVTLELAILQQQEKEASPTPERIRRASPRKAAELGHRAANARTRTESEEGGRPRPVPWHYRDLVRTFFAPTAPQP